MVEHAAVNRGVVGSSPTRGVLSAGKCLFAGFFSYAQRRKGKMTAGAVCAPRGERSRTGFLLLDRELEREMAAKADFLSSWHFLKIIVLFQN